MFLPDSEDQSVLGLFCIFVVAVLKACLLVLQSRLLCVATQHGDLESVCYLLKEARVPLPQEPSDNNPAILAAHYGHANLVKELLDSVPGNSNTSNYK